MGDSFVWSGLTIHNIYYYGIYYLWFDFEGYTSAFTAVTSMHSLSTTSSLKLETYTTYNRWDKYKYTITCVTSGMYKSVCQTYLPVFIPLWEKSIALCGNNSPEDTHHGVFRQGKNTYARDMGLKGGRIFEDLQYKSRGIIVLDNLHLGRNTCKTQYCYIRHTSRP